MSIFWENQIKSVPCLTAVPAMKRNGLTNTCFKDPRLTYTSSESEVNQEQSRLVLTCDKTFLQGSLTEYQRNRGNWPCKRKNYPSIRSWIEIVVKGPYASIGLYLCMARVIFWKMMVDSQEASCTLKESEKLWKTGNVFKTKKFIPSI